MTTIRVECYAGHRGEETPRRFYLGHQLVGVAEVLDRWTETIQSFDQFHGTVDSRMDRAVAIAFNNRL